MLIGEKNHIICASAVRQHLGKKRMGREREERSWQADSENQVARSLQNNLTMRLDRIQPEGEAGCPTRGDPFLETAVRSSGTEDRREGFTIGTINAYSRKPSEVEGCKTTRLGWGTEGNFFPRANPFKGAKTKMTAESERACEGGGRGVKNRK